MKYIAISVLLALCFEQAAAQNHRSMIRGEVATETGECLDYYNLVIEQLSDSTVVTGSCFDTSRFEYWLPNTDNELLLRITSLGYKDCYRVLRRGTTDADLGKITLSPEALGEVVVRPLR